MLNPSRSRSALWRRSDMPTPRPEQIWPRFPDADAPVVINWIDPAGQPRSADAEEAVDVALERALPSRIIPAYVDQTNTPGYYWSATDQALLGYESHNERRRMMMLDFDERVVAMAAQPLLIRAFVDPVDFQQVLPAVGQAGARGGWKRSSQVAAQTFTHYPDLFVRRSDGRGVVIDVTMRDRLERDEGVQQQVVATAQVCASIGWDYQVMTEAVGSRWLNIKYLAHYRRPLSVRADLVDELLARACEPVTIGALVDACATPDLARPVVMHLMWHHQLHVDIDEQLEDFSVVVAGTSHHATSLGLAKDRLDGDLG